MAGAAICLIGSSSNSALAKLRSHSTFAMVASDRFSRRSFATYSSARPRNVGASIRACAHRFFRAPDQGHPPVGASHLPAPGGPAPVEPWGALRARASSAYRRIGRPTATIEHRWAVAIAGGHHRLSVSGAWVRVMLIDTLRPSRDRLVFLEGPIPTRGTDTNQDTSKRRPIPWARRGIRHPATTR